MKRKLLVLLLVGAMITTSLVGCGSSSANEGTEVSQTEEEIVADSIETEVATNEAEANEYYEAGRVSLYGLDGAEVNLETAYDNFEKAVELGKNDANFYLGLLYDWYNYPEHNYEIAKNYYEKCGDNPYANISVGILYLYGQGVEEDKEKANEIFQKVIDEGCVDGYYGKACIANEEEDYDTAYECFNKVLEEGTEQQYITHAMADIGYLYQEGNGVEQDYAKALEWYQKAADLGNDYAMNQIGYFYNMGNGVEQDYAKALEWYQKAANLGHATATANIGYFYQEGKGVEQDYAKALEWYQKAANIGSVRAMNDIGYLYYEGNGVEQDYAKALEWYQKAADLGNATAIEWIGYFYQEGMGVEQDYAKAIEWYQKAADLDSTWAMNQIALLYYEGNGVEQDYAKALEWSEKAADLGDEIAKGNVEVLRSQMQ